MNSEPYIMEETCDYAVVFKPPRMHSVGIAGKDNSGGTLVDWFLGNVAGNDLPDGGLVHRLDFDTHGLVLFAKNRSSFDYFKSLQKDGGFIKEYSALCCGSTKDDSCMHPKPGFPPPPSLPEHKPSLEKPLIVMSYFRPYGPGRKEVRPVIKSSGGCLYRTEIINMKKHNDEETAVTARLKRGFRHQIRCHLYWIRSPIYNDPVYGLMGGKFKDHLALRAHALFFTDPCGAQKEYRIASLAF